MAGERPDVEHWDHIEDRGDGWAVLVTKCKVDPARQRRFRLSRDPAGYDEAGPFWNWSGRPHWPQIKPGIVCPECGQNVEWRGMV